MATTPVSEGRKSLVLFDQRSLVVKSLPGDRVFFQQLGEALPIDARAGEQGLIARERPLRLCERRLIRRRIDLRKQLASLHGASLDEVDAEKVAAGLGARIVSLVHACAAPSSVMETGTSCVSEMAVETATG